MWEFESDVLKEWDVIDMFAIVGGNLEKKKAFVFYVCKAVGECLEQPSWEGVDVERKT